MKHFILCIFFFLGGMYGQTQEFVGGLSYNFLLSRQLDEVVQAYNFSRPFLLDQQPLFRNGFLLSLSYFNSAERQRKNGIQVSYANYRSSALNETFSNKLNLHAIYLNYVFHFEGSNRFRRVYSAFSFGVKGSLLNRKVIGELFTSDEEQTKALGIGGSISGLLGFFLVEKTRFRLSTYMRLDYHPFFFAPRNEVVVNATKALVSSPFSHDFNFQVGLKYHFISSRNN
jgi:hypothetical protein